MNRAFVWIVVLVALVAGYAECLAQAPTGTIGFGYFRPEAPVGARLWLTERLAFDLGLGLAIDEFPDPTPTDPAATTNKTSFTVDVGVPLMIAGDPNTRFFIRPGFLYASRPAPSDPSESESDLIVSGHLGVEHFFARWFSLQVAHGISFRSFDPGLEETDTVTSVFTEDFGISSIGFHFYLF